MSVLVLSDGRQIAWEPTTDLICMRCKEPVDIHMLYTKVEAWKGAVNFTYDANGNGPLGSLHDGRYWYLHKGCSGIESALIRDGANICWGMHEMPYVLGLSPALDRQWGSLQKALKQIMPQAYDRLYKQWRPAIEKTRRVCLPKPAIHKPSPQLKPQRPGKPGHVYLIKAVGTDRIKIGHGKNATARLQALSTGTPFPLRLLHTIKAEDSLALEQELHRKYAAYRQHNEWFELPAHILEQLLQEDSS